MTQHNQSGVICAGNWIVDIVHDIESWPEQNDLVRISDQKLGIGGGAANVVSDLRSFGVAFPLIPVGKIGKDRYGEFALNHCHDFDLPTTFIKVADQTPTAHTHVMSVPGGSRTFFYQGGTNDTLDTSDFPFAELRATGARVFYLGYLMLLKSLEEFAVDGRTKAAHILAMARDAGMITCVDLVSADSTQFAAIVCATLGDIDYLIINETEASRSTGLPVTDENGLIESEALLRCATRLLAQGVHKAVIIHSPDAALWLDHAESVWSYPEAIPAQAIISSVGAGDAFCAGVVYGIHESWSVENTLKLAHRAAGTALSGHTATDGLRPLVQLVPELTTAHGSIDTP